MRAVLAGLALSLFLILSLAPGCLAQTGAVGPSGLHVAYGPDPATTMTVAWVGPPATVAQLELTGPDGQTETVAAQAEQPPGSPRWTYHAALEGLAPATTYTYQAVLDGQASQEHTVTTAPAPGTGSRLTLTHFADHGTAWPANTRADGSAPEENVALARDLGAQVHLVSGDTSYAEGDPIQWDTYLEMISPLAASTPTMTVPGNHEREGTPTTSGDVLGFTHYDARFKMPREAEGRWWAIQVDHAVIVGLNSETGCQGDPGPSLAPGPGVSCETSSELAPQEDQLAFLEQALSSAAEAPEVAWTIVVLHHTLYSSATHGSNPLLQENWGTVFDEHGVDLVLQGHDHVYERSLPIRGGTAAPEGTVYLTNGAGGSGHYAWIDEPAWSAARDNEHYGTLELTLTPDRGEGRFVSLAGETIDTFTLENLEAGGVRMPGQGASASEPTGDQGQAETPLPVGLLVVALATAGLAGRRAG